MHIRLGELSLVIMDRYDGWVKDHPGEEISGVRRKEEKNTVEIHPRIVKQDREEMARQVKLKEGQSGKRSLELSSTEVEEIARLLSCIANPRLSPLSMYRSFSGEHSLIV
jgi:hypothetical protein